MRHLTFIIIFIFAVSTSAFSKDRDYGSLTVIQINSIYDGDTFRANIHGLHPLIGQDIGIRVAGIDTPEMRGKCETEKRLARQAKQYTVAMLRNGTQVVLKDVQRGKYFRIVAQVYIDGRNLTEELIRAGHGVRYEGGKKAKDWCA